MRFLVCILLALLAACSDSGSSASSKDPDQKIDMEEFVHFSASTDPVQLGTESEAAWAKERPPMKVVLDYDFYLSKREVSCDDFSAVLERKKGDGCEGELPVSMVTFFDAVLYANAKSKTQGLDTAYSYVSKIFDKDGRCVDLVGFRFDSEVDAYRLPTEAEWMKAAEKYYATEKAWNRNNSEGSVHPSCEADVSKEGLCDIAGNLKEWVNDWLGMFKDTTLVNYIGAPNGGSLGEHVIKGGYYGTNPDANAAYSRGAVYTVSASTFERYVGFRLAFGKIPNAVRMGNNGETVSSNASILTTSQNLSRKLGTANAKLAFRNNLNGNILFVDFFDGKPQVTELVDTLDAFHPDISPDGKWVVFCTGLEGSSSKSSIYIRPLSAFSASVKLDVENGSIPRFRVTPDGDTVIVYVSSAENNSDESKFKSLSTWQVSFSKGKFGTPEKLFDGAYHGGISSDERLAVTGSRILRTRMAGDESNLFDSKAETDVWYDGEQACNVSLSKDDSKRTLFLDFGGKAGEKFVGEKYDVHERLLIADSTGKLIQSVAAPRGYTFDHTEWALEKIYEGEKQQFVVATLVTTNGAHEKIVLIDLGDSSVTDLVFDDDLYHPCLWMGTAKNPKMDDRLVLDSAGVYFSDKMLITDALWRFKMELFWHYKDSTRVLAVGSSRPLGGFRTKLLDTTHWALNVAQTPNSMFTSRDFLNHYAFGHMKNLKYVVLSIDVDIWSQYYNFFDEDYKNYPGFVFDEHHDYWGEEYPEGLLERVQNNVGNRSYKQEEDEKGFFLSECGSVWDSIPEMDGDTTSKNEDELVDENLDALANILALAKKRDVTVIGVVFPQSPFYKETGAFGRHGLSRSAALKAIERLEKMEKEYPNFIFMDENKMGDHDYEPRHFSDSDHLCSTGASKLTRRVEKLIRTLEQGDE